MPVAICLPLRTDWGKQRLPEILLHFGIISSDQYDGLQDILGNGFLPQTDAIEQEIRHRVKPDGTVLFVVGLSNPAGSDLLKYRLYPIKAELAYKPPSTATLSKYECEVDWPSNKDIRLFCPNLVWTWQNGRVQKP
jgi:hypothetical protein